jgi:oligoendopeptidase F
MRDRSRRPFIFMNAAGLHRDVETMVHEAGHAFHSALCAHDPLVWYRESPIEFAEIASMTMELLTMPMWDAFYADASSADRARRQQLEGSLSLLPWIATIDAFQHWMYLDPGHTREERRAYWLTLDERFGHAVSWAGLEDERASAWQRQSHLFGNPFYYIEYGIAQLGALGIWLNALEDGVEHALADYKAALTIGGAQPLPALFEAAGVPFDFSADRVRTLVEAVEGELSKLPE